MEKWSGFDPRDIEFNAHPGCRRDPFPGFDCGLVYARSRKCDHETEDPEKTFRIGKTTVRCALKVGIGPDSP